MKSSMWLLMSCGSLLFAVGCGNGSSSGGSGSGAGTGGGGNSQCQLTDCFQQCFCETSDGAGCAAKCQTAPTPTGTGTTPVPTSTGTTPVPTSTGTTPVPTSTGTTPVPTSTGTTPTPTPTGTVPQPPPLPPGAQSITLTTDFFDAPPGGDSYFCQNFSNPFGKDVDILRSESFMTAGSHHMFVFREPGIGDTGIQSCSGLEIAEFIHSAQTPQQLTSYPEGVGRFMGGGDGLRVNVHYINLGTAPIHAQVVLTMTYVDTNQVQAHAAQIFLNDMGINVPPGQAGSTQRSTQLPYAIKLIGGVSHMHSRATHFLATSGGQTLYEGTDWDEPQSAVFDPAMDLAAGSTITWGCEYQNTTNYTLTFGETAARNEMCIFSGVFYPAPGGTGITVNTF